MDKAIRQNIDRRALLKGASIATIAAAIPSAPPSLPAPRLWCLPRRLTRSSRSSPNDQLRVLARAADGRVAEIKRPLGPVVDFGRPEFAPMAQGNSYDKAKDGEEITREYLED
jgi:hypothetical protein